MITQQIVKGKLVGFRSYKQNNASYRPYRQLCRSVQTTVEEKVSKKNFMDEMRQVAMKLHTKQQAPKEGEKIAPQTKLGATHQSYVQFLEESREVYDAFESIVKAKAGVHPEYLVLQDTGLDRSAALREDIQWFKQTYNVEPEPASEEGPGKTYAKYLDELSGANPPAFMCHFYNYYFAHTAGGRMIGAALAKKLLDGTTIAFYKYDRDLKELKDTFRQRFSALTEDWTREQKDQLLQETEMAFKQSGGLLKLIFQPAE